MHFTSNKYNAFAYSFKSKSLNQKVYESRNLRYLYDKLGQRFTEPQLMQYAFANLFFGDAVQTRDFSDEPYINYCKRIQTFTHRLIKDLDKHSEMHLNHLLSPINGDIPIIVSSYLQGNLMAETVIALHCVTNFINLINKKVTDTLLWPSVSQRLLKATVFVGQDINQLKIREVIKKYYSRKK